MQGELLPYLSTGENTDENVLETKCRAPTASLEAESASLLELVIRPRLAALLK